jgi:acyl-CoA synthetase (AMP-forming)/AMP-acid ligase II
MSLRSFTLHDLINRNARLYGSKTALVLGDQRVTHAQYAERTAHLAAGLAAAGVGQGDRLAILAPNCLEYVDLLGAAAQLGAIMVPINWRLSAEEVAYVIEDVAPRVLIVADEFKTLVPQDGMAGTLRYTLGAAQAPWQAVSELYLVRDTPAADLPGVTDDSGLLIIHTAAVGGRPRGALLSHRGLIAASLQMERAWHLTAVDVNLGVLPLFHVAAFGLLLATQQAGGATLLLTRFDPPSLVKHIDEDGGSLIGTFPPMLGVLLDAAAAQGSALVKLRVVYGIDVPDTIARLRTICPQATFWSTYGQTETSGLVSLAPFDECPGSAGRPTALNTVAVVDELDRQLPVGATGEIVVRGPMVFQGYWRREADNAFTLRNGWHHTGDMGHLDAEGYLWYSGRSPAKELIRSGGENVYPAEVERAVLEHPALAQVVVIGVPDVQWGEAVKALCVLKAGHTLSAEELIEFVGARIARYKKPKHVVFVQSLPRTAAGLMDRDAVKTAQGRA